MKVLLRPSYLVCTITKVQTPSPYLRVVIYEQPLTPFMMAESDPPWLWPCDDPPPPWLCPCFSSWLWPWWLSSSAAPPWEWPWAPSAWEWPCAPPPWLKIQMPMMLTTKPIIETGWNGKARSDEQRKKNYLKNFFFSSLPFSEHGLLFQIKITVFIFIEVDFALAWLLLYSLPYF